MKIPIKPYVRNLIRENIVYIAGFFLLIFLSVFVYLYNIDRISANEGKILSLGNEIKEYEQKTKIIQAALELGEEDLESYLEIVNSLVPNVEDYFSIVYALEEVAKKTNFSIKSYSINIKSSTKNKLQLVIVGVGDENAFTKFLSDYTFSSGRLITIERIELTPQFSGSMALNVNFYNQKVEISPSERIAFKEQTLQELRKIKDKITLVIKEPAEEASSSGYPTKINPF